MIFPMKYFPMIDAYLSTKSRSSGNNVASLALATKTDHKMKGRDTKGKWTQTGTKHYKKRPKK